MRPYPFRVVDGVEEPITPPLPPIGEQRFCGNHRPITPPIPASYLAHNDIEPLMLNGASSSKAVTPAQLPEQPPMPQPTPEDGALIPYTQPVQQEQTLVPNEPFKQHPTDAVRDLRTEVDLVQRDYNQLINVWADSEQHRQHLEAYCGVLQSDAFWHALDLKVSQDVKHIILKANKMLTQRNHELHEALRKLTSVLKRSIKDKKGYEDEIDNCHRDLEMFWKGKQELETELAQCKRQIELLTAAGEGLKEELEKMRKEQAQSTDNAQSEEHPTHSNGLTRLHKRKHASKEVDQEPRASTQNVATMIKQIQQGHTGLVDPKQPGPSRTEPVATSAPGTLLPPSQSTVTEPNEHVGDMSGPFLSSSHVLGKRPRTRINEPTSLSTPAPHRPKTVPSRIFRMVPFVSITPIQDATSYTPVSTKKRKVMRIDCVEIISRGRTS